MNNNLLDDQSLEVDIYAEVQQKNKTYTLDVLRLILLLAILYPISMIDASHSLLERFVDSFIFSIIVTPFLSIIIAIPLSFLPYKGLFLHQKYKRTFLLTLIVLDALLALIFFLSFLYHILIKIF